jgi:hypothetical protein
MQLDTSSMSLSLLPRRPLRLPPHIFNKSTTADVNAGVSQGSSILESRQSINRLSNAPAEVVLGSRLYDTALQERDYRHERHWCIRPERGRKRAISHLIWL